MFPEALMLHYMDDLDSKMEAMRAQFEREAENDESVDQLQPFDGPPAAEFETIPREAEGGGSGSSCGRKGAHASACDRSCGLRGDGNDGGGKCFFAKSPRPAVAFCREENYSRREVNFLKSKDCLPLRCSPPSIWYKSAARALARTTIP